MERLIDLEMSAARVRYGDELGNAFLNLVYGEPKSLLELHELRLNFSRIVVRSLRSGSEEEATKALAAVVEAAGSGMDGINNVALGGFIPRG